MDKEVIPMRQEAYSITAKELVEAGRAAVPEELRSARHLIYSSPATLAFNSPGAEGFGVKRAGLTVPGSVMLVISPGCCGRNTTLLTERREYDGRFFFLLLDETDIVTGRHLRKIPAAVEEVVEACKVRPSVVMLCITCVDALLGTDMDRVCRKAQEAAGLPVLPCYMYALTREGRTPPMVAVRKTLYQLLSPRKKRATSMNILGSFTPFADDCELYDILRGLGIKTIREISRCPDFASYQQMSEANFNLVLNPESRLAAQDLQKRLGIPWIELARLYQIDKIHRQYELLGTALQSPIDDSSWQMEAQAVIDAVRARHAGKCISVGEWLNGDAFELSLALLSYGFRIPEIFGTVTDGNFVYIRRLAEQSPDTRIYSNLSPTMLYYDISANAADLTVGKDAAYYHPGVPNVAWNEEVQPFGYRGLVHLLEKMDAALIGNE